MDDWQLLQQYTESGSEAAFHTLVERHLALVRSSALRQVGDPHLADEISQAVFILLARKSGSLRREVVLAGWLFRTTRFVASHVLRTERRRRREQEAFDMQNTAISNDTWKRIAPILDEGLSQLGELDRKSAARDVRWLAGCQLPRGRFWIGRNKQLLPSSWPAI